MTRGCNRTWAFTSKTGAALLVVAVMLGAAGCSIEEEPQGELEAGATSTPGPVEETPAPPSETSTPREAGSSDESEDEYEEGEGTENDNSSELFPDPVVPEHGTFYFGVYFVVTTKSARDPKVKAAEADLRNLGFEPSVGGIDCDSGAKEALGLDPSRSYTDVALYFATRSDADMFVTLYDPGVVGTAKVKTFCLD
jgi:hypothetical protein